MYRQDDDSRLGFLQSLALLVGRDGNGLGYSIEFVVEAPRWVPGSGSSSSPTPVTPAG